MNWQYQLISDEGSRTGHVFVSGGPIEPGQMEITRELGDSMMKAIARWWKSERKGTKVRITKPDGTVDTL